MILFRSGYDGHLCWEHAGLSSQYYWRGEHIFCNNAALFRRNDGPQALPPENRNDKRLNSAALNETMHQKTNTIKIDVDTYI